MAPISSPDLTPKWRKGSRSFLAFSWVSGLVCGVLCGLSADESIFSMMRSAGYAPVSIFGLLIVTLLPFFLSAFLICFAHPAWLIFLCFIKAFLFAFVSVGFLYAFGSASWLVRCFLLFSDCISFPLLYFIWLRGLDRSLCIGEWFLVLAVALLIGSVDYCIISPFWARLIEIWKG